MIVKSFSSSYRYDVTLPSSFINILYPYNINMEEISMAVRSVDKADFVVLAREELSTSRCMGISETLVRYAGDNLVVVQALYRPDGSVLLPKGAVICAFDWDPETGRAAYQIDLDTVIVCSVGITLNPVLTVYDCS